MFNFDQIFKFRRFCYSGSWVFVHLFVNLVKVSALETIIWAFDTLICYFFCGGRINGDIGDFVPSGSFQPEIPVATCLAVHSISASHAIFRAGLTHKFVIQVVSTDAHLTFFTHSRGGLGLLALIIFQATCDCRNCGSLTFSSRAG